MTDFIHLQTHSEYSMLQSAARIGGLVEKAVSLGQHSIALTDNGCMFGILEFYNSCRAKKIRPILGCDFYIAPDSRKNQDYPSGAPPYHRLILLARNNTGYKNLLRICSDGYMDGFYLKPRIDRESLEGRGEGLICLTGNYQGELGYHLLRGEKEAAVGILKFYEAAFGKENIYLCVQDHGLPEEKDTNKRFLELHHTGGYSLVGVNDVHYINPEDVEAHDVLLCIDGNYRLDDTERPRFPAGNYFMRSSEEMAELLGEYPGAVENTVKIAESCDVTIEFGKLYWPRCPIPKGYKTDDDYLARLAQEGLARRFSTVTEEMKERLRYELEVMKKMLVAGYMLIVQDFINAARDMDIPVGPGRGSAVGSLVSYAIGITDVDPLRFNLLFERFLNPERVSMPDIDTDFSDLDRGRVIKYVVEKYGQDSVAQIVTYGRMKAKMVLRDVGRTMGFEASELNRICKLFPPEKPFAKLQEAVDSSPALKKELEASDQTVRLKEIALKLEGFVRQAGMHAAAVIITPEPVVNWAPLFKQPGSDMVMVQYDKTYLEDVGLLKMDFLGLRNLSVIKDCLTSIEESTGQKLDPLKFPEKDLKTLELFSKGLTVGVFQFESRGMQDYLRKLKPSGIEDLIAMNALYRPGPIENIPRYIARKHGREAADYYHPNLEPILRETYGVIVYQEQVMQIAQVLSGFTLGGADEMRRVMAKKKLEKMAKLKPRFVDGAVERGYAQKLAENIWDVLVPFSSYAFNKSHSAAYATIAYQTAYLKAHYPGRFLAANMTSEMNDTDRLVILLNDCRRMGIKVIGPNVNLSGPAFIGTDDTITYGLGGIKNVGLSAARKIVEEREKNGKFKSILELCKRLGVGDLNRRAIESLIYAGAMDELKGSRARQFAAVETAMAIAARHQQDLALGQTSLFSVQQGSGSFDEQDFKLPEVDAWPYNEMLSKEKEVLGLYLSGHPLDDFRMEIDAFSASSLDASSLEVLKPDTVVILGGILTELRTKISQRDNRSFAFGVLQDFSGRVEVTFWSDVYEKFMDLVEVDAILLIRGKIKKDPEARIPFKFIAEKVLPMEQARDKLARSVHVKLNVSGLPADHVQRLHRLCEKYPGRCQFILHLDTGEESPYLVKSGNICVDPGSAFTKILEDLAGEGNVWISQRGYDGG